MILPLLRCRFRLTPRRLFLFFLTLPLLFILRELFLLFRLASCSLRDAESDFRSLCLDFADRAIDGSACRRLCGAKTLSPSRCLSFRQGKRVWELYDADDEDHSPLIFKRSRSPPDPLPNEFFLRPAPTKRLKALIAESAASRTAPSVPIDADDPALLRKLFGDSSFIESFKADDKNIAARFNVLWRLIQQDEFVLSSILAPRTDAVLGIAGFCGAFYAVPRVNVVSNAAHLGAAAARLNAFRALLVALEAFESEFLETLNICDMKMTNFGFYVDEVVGRKSLKKVPNSLTDPHLKAALIDLDAAPFDTQLASIFRPSASAEIADYFPKAKSGASIAPSKNETQRLTFEFGCATDADCVFFDCRSRCGDDGVCSTVRIGNNARSMCEKMLRPATGWRSWLGWSTPLVDETVVNEVSMEVYRAVLRDCLSDTHWEICERVSSKKECVLSILRRFRRVFDG